MCFGGDEAVTRKGHVAPIIIIIMRFLSLCIKPGEQMAHISIPCSALHYEPLLVSARAVVELVGWNEG